MKRDEDQEQTLIFVDMLGFAALIGKHPCRIEDNPPTDDGYGGAHTAPTQSQFNLFDQVLDRSIQQQPDGGALLHESSRARTMPTDRILTCRGDTTRVGRGRSSE